MSQSQKHETLNEGLLSYSVDLVSAFRIVKILYQDWTATNAFKLGIIDDQGNKIKKPVTMEEKSAYSPFIRLIFKLKKMINAFPGGDTKLGSLAAAYALLKEGEFDVTTLSKDDLETLFEDTPVNTSGGGAVASKEQPLNKKAKVIRRTQPGTNTPKIFAIREEEFSNYFSAKAMYKEWEKENLHLEDIQQFIKENPGIGFVVQAPNGRQLFLR